MRKVLAVASVAYEHREIVFKEIKKMFKRIKISLDILLQQETIKSQFPPENGNVFKSYPYITLTIPNYEQHREYLEKVYKNNVLFEKFILLISQGNNYDELVLNRNEDLLREHCRNWNTSVKCTFDSTPLFTNIEEQVNKIDKVFGELDIRGKVTEIDAKKKFHLIQDHRKAIDDDHPPVSDPPKVLTKTDLFKLFFGLEVGCGKRDRCRGGAAYAANNNYYANYEEMDVEEEEKMMVEEEETQDIQIWDQQQIIKRGSSSRRHSSSSSVKKGVNKRLVKSRFEQSLTPLQNPYLKKSYPCEVELSEDQMS